ncbi:MAG: mechanosensitive ion channel [Alphaproteobacteria bacterium]|nr:mechanosensitive ion channel [Alphaproteobacteria bacterium]NCQ89232.1 mechanosensitive ion channel [Alphaproteobacteria bacterium]NCT08092.1 mechanosensitive ion channel [Alphaproteobacteria bacterium]
MVQTFSLENINITALQTKSVEWVGANILTLDFGVQMAIITLSFIAAFFIRKYSKPRLNDLLNKLTIPYRLIEAMRNMLRLLLPAISLIFIFLGTKIIDFGMLDISVTFSEVVMKLLFAWIIIRMLVQLIENRFARNIFALTIWGLAALSIFGVLDETMSTLDAIGFNIGEFRLSALSVTKGVLGIFILMYGALFLANLADKKLAGVRSLNPSSRVLIAKITRVFLFISALLIGVTSAGIDLSLFAVFSGAVGLGIGFGLQKVISNLFSGMLLLMDQSIKPGDIIEMEGTFGWVNHMGARYTELVTRDNKSYLVPNEEFITQQVVNWSHGNTLVRIETSFGVHYNSDPHKVKALAVEAAKKPDRVVDSPVPVCHLVEFGDSSLNFVLRYWIKDAEKGITNTKGDVMLALWDAFKEHGIEIPYPHREVFVHKS